VPVFKKFPAGFCPTAAGGTTWGGALSGGCDLLSTGRDVWLGVREPSPSHQRRQTCCDSSASTSDS